MGSIKLPKKPLDRLHELMASHIEHGNLPGLVTAVATRGDARIDAVGDKTVGARGPMTRDTIFRIASLTKPIVAAAAMALVDEGRVRLDEPEHARRRRPDRRPRRVVADLRARYAA